MSKKWKRFIRDNDHYCPYCPEAERDESYITTSALKAFLKENRKPKQDKVVNSLLNAGYQWAGILSHPEKAMLNWSILDWTIVAEKYAPSVTRQINVATIEEIHKWLRKEYGNELAQWIDEGIEKVYGPE